ncbi:MAG: hypothetical protein CMF67_00680 [Magnetovibrio sp.]|nr:hypothetical protein [Magnetovibrio sp.]
MGQPVATIVCYNLAHRSLVAIGLPGENFRLASLQSIDGLRSLSAKTFLEIFYVGMTARYECLPTWPEMTLLLFAPP